MNRRTAREKAMQILFQHDFNDIDLEEAIEEFLEPEEHDEYLVQLIHGVKEHIKEIDAMINEYLVNWTIERIASVEKTVLRIATYEFNYLDDIPTSVSINEAIELAKKFGDEKSGKFVNGVLSKIQKK